MLDVTRRQFITLLGAQQHPFGRSAARAQQGQRMPRWHDLKCVA
jgi:hypothetical protein